MRIDQLLQKVGIVKRRSLAKELCDNGAVRIAGQRVKPAREVAVGDKLSVKFRNRLCTYEILEIPSGSVKKESRGDYVRLASEEYFHEGI